MSTAEGDKGLASEASTSYGLPVWVTRPAEAVYGVLWHSGTGATLAACSLWSLNAVSIKVLGQPGRNVVFMEIVTVRGAVCMLLALLVGAIAGMDMLKSQRKNWALLSVRGVSGAVSMALYLVSLMYLPLAEAITLFMCHPAITMLLAWLFLGEPLVLKAVAGIACSLVGVVLVTQPPALFGGHDNWTRKRILGVTCGILAAITSSTAFVSIRKISRTESALAIAVWFHCSSLLLGASSLAVRVPDAPTLPNLLDWVIMLAVALTSFGGQLVVGRAYQIEQASKVAAVSYVQVLYGFLFGWLLFGESLSLLSVLGSILIAGGIIASSLTKSKPASEPPDKQQYLELAEDGAAGGEPAVSSAALKSSPSTAGQHGAGTALDDMASKAVAGAGLQHGPQLATAESRRLLERGSPGQSPGPGQTSVQHADELKPADARTQQQEDGESAFLLPVHQT